MPMTLRLTDDEERSLEMLAEAEGVSKREAVARAINERAARLRSDARVRDLARTAISEYGPLLERLSQ